MLRNVRDLPLLYVDYLVKSLANMVLTSGQHELFDESDAVLFMHELTTVLGNKHNSDDNVMNLRLCLADCAMILATIHRNGFCVKPDYESMELCYCLVFINRFAQEFSLIELNSKKLHPKKLHPKELDLGVSLLSRVNGLVYNLANMVLSPDERGLFDTTDQLSLMWKLTTILAKKPNSDHNTEKLTLCLANCAMILGAMYENGFGVEKDDCTCAESYYTFAGEHNNAPVVNAALVRIRGSVFQPIGGAKSLGC